MLKTFNNLRSLSRSNLHQYGRSFTSFLSSSSSSTALSQSLNSTYTFQSNFTQKRTVTTEEFIESYLSTNKYPPPFLYEINNYLLSNYRNSRNPQLNQKSSNLSLKIFGTSSAISSTTRHVTCNLLKVNKIGYLIDCGEGSQNYLQHSSFSISQLKKVFITHLHGDHYWGLPGILLLASNFNHLEPIDIYGPEGLRDYLRIIFQTSYSKLYRKFRVHELHQIKYKYNKVTQNDLEQFNNKFDHLSYRKMDETPLFDFIGELRGYNYYPDANGHYHLSDDDNILVQAAPLKHSIPCVGYVFKEKDFVSNTNMELLSPIIKKYEDEIKTRHNFQNSLQFINYLKNLPYNSTYTFQDNTTISPSQFWKLQEGRKLTILGDTCESSPIAKLAYRSNVLVHEATNSPYDNNKYLTFEESHKAIIKNFHSSPTLAGNFSSLIQAKNLILTHFSSRYDGSWTEWAEKVMTYYFQIPAQRASKLPRSRVHCAYDFMHYNIHVEDEEENKKVKVEEISEEEVEKERKDVEEIEKIMKNHLYHIDDRNQEEDEVSTPKESEVSSTSKIMSNHHYKRRNSIQNKDKIVQNNSKNNNYSKKK